MIYLTRHLPDVTQCDVYNLSWLVIILWLMYVYGVACIYVSVYFDFKFWFVCAPLDTCHQRSVLV